MVVQQAGRIDERVIGHDSHHIAVHDVQDPHRRLPSDPRESYDLQPCQVISTAL